MKLTVLVDNNTLIDRYFLGEPAVSYLIEDGDQRTLFDVGYSDVFLQNARKMNINLLDLDFLVLSHGHADHTWGLDPLIRSYTEAAFENVSCKKPVAVFHPDCLQTKKLKMMGIGELGSIISMEKLAGIFEVRSSKEPLWLTDRLVFLGEIERRNPFEAQVPIGTVEHNGMEEDDYLWDDSALAYCSEQGLVIITGCSHAGICNIVEQARRVCGQERVADIIGGFHLLNPSPEQLQGTLHYMEQLGAPVIHACHCTDLSSKIALSKVVSLKEVGVGSCFQYK